MRELDVAEVRRRDEVPEGVRIWSGRWCHWKKAGGVRSRYFVRQYRTEWSEDAFCWTPGWGAIRLLLAVASLMRWMVMLGDFSTAFMHTPLLDSDEYWIEPSREVVPDTRIVWKLKKALNGLVTASKRFQQHLLRLLQDLGFECCPLLPTLLRNPITGTIMVVHVDDPMASGPPGEAEKLFEALGKHIATRPGQPLHFTDASVYLGARLWSTKFGFVEMPKEGYIEGIRTIAEQAGLHVRGRRGAATPGIKDKPKTKDDEEYIGKELRSIYRQIVGKVLYTMLGGRKNPETDWVMWMRETKRKAHARRSELNLPALWHRALAAMHGWAGHMARTQESLSGAAVILNKSAEWWKIMKSAGLGARDQTWRNHKKNWVRGFEHALSAILGLGWWAEAKKCSRKSWRQRKFVFVSEAVRHWGGSKLTNKKYTFESLAPATDENFT